MQEFCNGGTLRQALQRRYFCPTRPGARWPLVSGVLRGIAEGMAYVHSKRICHGDLNPSNILLKVRPPSIARLTLGEQEARCGKRMWQPHDVVPLPPSESPASVPGHSANGAVGIRCCNTCCVRAV